MRLSLLALSLALTAAPANAQLVGGQSGGGSVIPGAASAGGGAKTGLAAIEGSWGGLFVCAGREGSGLLFDIGQLGGKTVVDMRSYRERVWRDTFDATETQPGVFDLVSRSGGWNYRVTLDDDAMAGISPNGPQDCRLRLVRALGGFDQ